MTDDQIAAIMEWPVEHMQQDRDPLSLLERVRALVSAVRADERERCAVLLDAEHERCKHRNNYAAVHARMIRERGPEQMAARLADLQFAAIRST